MSTKYFILSKQNEDINVNQNQIYFINNDLTYILPQSNIDYYIKHGLFESNLIQWSKQFCSKNKNFIDIGAHSGTYSISLAKSSNHVYAFEPQKMTYYSLCGSVALSNIDNITCYNCGLGTLEQCGNQTLKIISNDGGGSTLCDTNDNVLKQELIEVSTLDNYNLVNIGFIKIDVEGNEENVLKGAVETLKKSNYPPIIFESNNVNVTLFNFIKNLGYKVLTINGYSNMFIACHN